MANYENLFDDLEKFLVMEPDQRTSKWLLMDSVQPVIYISISYLIVVWFLVPKYMENRKAFDITQILRLYNLCHFLVSVMFLYLSSSLAWLTTYSWRCEPVNRSPTGVPMIIANVAWWFLMFKIVNLLETVILVSGKRSELVTKYHIVHHLLMPIMIWAAVKYVPGGHGTFFCFINSFTHVIIYGYLTLTGLCITLKGNFPWFRYVHKFLTAAEIIVGLAHAFQLLIKNDCNFPIVFVYYTLAFGILYFIMSTFFHHRDNKDLKESDLV